MIFEEITHCVRLPGKGDLDHGGQSEDSNCPATYVHLSVYPIMFSSPLILRDKRAVTEELFRTGRFPKDKHCAGSFHSVKPFRAREWSTYVKESGAKIP